VSSNAVIVYEGHVPVFCDVGESLSLDFDSVVRAIKTKGAKAVMWVHYGGSVSPDFYKLMDWIAEEKNGSIPVIEDCAHAAGAFYADGTRVGSRKDTIACFSFHSVKNLPIFDGGMICCPVKEQDERARRLSWLGIDKSTFARTNNDSNELYKWSYNVPELGWKYNANDIAATIGLVQLKSLDSDNAWRNALYERYFSLLRTKSNIRVFTHKDGSSHHLMVLGVNRRDSVIAALKANKFAPGMHYLPNYLFPAFQDYDHEDCERTERYACRIVSLPNHLDVTYEDVAKVCEVILNVQS
jgi:dTDP-4-amino-4,6-dideoxygalactose transaminase